MTLRRKRNELLKEISANVENTEEEGKPIDTEEIYALMDELMVLKFRIKLTKQLYKKKKMKKQEVNQFKQVLTDLFDRKFERFCKKSKNQFSGDLAKQDMDLRLSELKDEMELVSAPTKL